MYHSKLRRLCKTCGSYFIPNSKHSKVCESCKMKRLKQLHEGLKKKHEKNIRWFIKNYGLSNKRSNKPTYI